MNISKAKNILIIAFLVLNGILVFQLTLPNWRELSAGADMEEMQQMEENLQEKNYELQTLLPREPKYSSFITVKPAAKKQTHLKEAFFKDQEVNTIRLEEEDKLIKETGEARLIFLPGGYYHYNCKYDRNEKGLPEEEQQEEEQLSEQQVRQIAEEFLENRGLKRENLYPGIIQQLTPSSYKVEFYQEFEGAPVFSSYKNMVVEAGKVVEMESYWLQVVGKEEEREMEVIPAAAAVTRLLEEKGVASSTREITDVDLGYFSEEYNAENWEVPPVWRIILDGEEFYYVNAFIGNIEAVFNQE